MNNKIIENGKDPHEFGKNMDCNLDFFHFIDDEMTLFTCIYRWLEEKKSLMIELGEENIDLHLDHFINVLLSRIRFPMMTPSQLADLLLNPLSQTHTELLVERIRMAMCYHKNQLELSEKGRVSFMKDHFWDH